MFVSKRWACTPLGVLTLTAAAFLSTPSQASMDVSAHFRGIAANAGGLPVIGARARFQIVDVGIQSFSDTTVTTLAFSGGLRWAWNERERITPSFGLLARVGRGDIEVGPSISAALQLFQIGAGSVALRLDQELWFNTTSRNLDPHLLLGASWILP